jgi:hypothetical protein
MRREYRIKRSAFAGADAKLDQKSLSLDGVSVFYERAFGRQFNKSFSD